MNTLDVLSQYFSLDELKNLSHRLGYDSEEFNLTSKSAYARELIQHCSRRKRTEDLVRLIEEARDFLLYDSASKSFQEINPISSNPKLKFNTFGNIIKEKWKLIVVAGSLILTIINFFSCYINCDLILQVNVIEAVSGLPIERANVIVDLSGIPPLSDLTDNNGNAVFKIHSNYQDQQIQINVRATNYQPNQQTLLFDSNNLSTQYVQLTPIGE